jgi:Na+-translocating ferredoxin:NAD+ oxidoreductase subunit B
MNELSRRINAALPQTQCTRCGYPDCASYAQAIADGETTINRCPPGGEEGIARLAELTGQAVQALDTSCGIEGPLTLAVIDEDWCIGCTLCIKACPTDAIVGSNKLMHTVIEPYCTGCELCIPVCPVDCISLEVVDESKAGWQAWTAEQAEQAKERYALRNQRLAREALEHQHHLEEKARTKLADLGAHSLHSDPAVLDTKRRVIEAALERARLKREQANKG